MKLTSLARLTGTVQTAPEYSHTSYGKHYWRMMIATTRQSGTRDYIPVTMKEKTTLDWLPAVGDRVHVIGQVRSHSEAKPEGGYKLHVEVTARKLRPPEEGDPDNAITLGGYLNDTPSYRVTPFGREIADMLVCIPSQRHKKINKIPAIAWGKNAQLAQLLEAGSPIELTGRMQSREYRKALPGGGSERHTVLEVSASSMTAETDALEEADAAEAAQE